MTVTARLSRAIHQAFGEEPADDLVNWMGQMESSRSELREMFDLNQSRTDAKFEAFQARTDAKFDAVESRLTARMDAGVARLELRFAQIDSRFEQVDAKIERKSAELIKWMFVFWIGTVGIVLAMAQFLK